MRTLRLVFGGIPGRFWCGSGWVQTQKEPYFVGLFCCLVVCNRFWNRRQKPGHAGDNGTKLH